MGGGDEDGGGAEHGEMGWDSDDGALLRGIMTRTT